MSASPRRKGTDMEKRHISAVQDGEKRVEYMRPRRWGDWLLLLVVLCWGFVMGFVAFAEGVDRGTTIGIDSCRAGDTVRSEEHTSELQSLMRISYAVFCLKKQKKQRSSNDEKTVE